MEKPIDLRESVHALCTAYPELIEILAAMGFKDITRPGMLQSAGRFMTLPKGAAMKKLDLGDIKRKLTESGFTIKE